MATTETITQVGGKGGHFTSLDYAPGIRMMKIAVWADSDKIRGVKIWSTNDTDGMAVMLGSQVGKCSDFNIPSTDWIKALSLWDDGGTRLGWIKIELAGGSIFDFGLTGEWVKARERSISVGSGICVGWTARAGDDVDALGFKFLKATTETITQVGGHGGDLRVLGYSPGIRMTKIAVWADSDKIRGVKIWSSNDTDGMAEMIGKQVGKYRDFNIPSTGWIKSLSLWDNGAGTRLGWIKIELSGGSIFAFGLTGPWLKKAKERKISVGSGICVGWTARSCDDVDALGFKFLLPIRSSQIVNITYPGLGMQASSIHKTVDRYNNQHSGGPPFTWNWHRSIILTRSSTFKWDAGMTAGVKTTFSGGIPFVAKNETDVSFGVSASIIKATTYQEQEELMWNLSGSLAPGQRVQLVATTYEGILDDVEFNAVMEITLEPSGAVYKYPFNGKYAGVSYSGVDITQTSSTGI